MMEWAAAASPPLDWLTLGMVGAPRRTMMRNRVGPLAALCLIACGPSQAEYDRVIAEKSALAERVTTLERELDEIQSGAPRRLARLTTASERGQYAEVLAMADSLIATHPEAPEAVRAREFRVVAAQRIAAKRAADSAAAEQTRQQAAMGERERLRQIIRVGSVVTSDPNSSGGVDVEIRFQNRSSKTIKYVSFSVTPYNAVGDSVECTIRDRSNAGLRVTGPIAPGSWYGDYRSWENVWYNSTIVRGKLTDISIEYTDGSTVDLTGEQVGHVRY